MNSKSNFKPSDCVFPVGNFSSETCLMPNLELILNLVDSLIGLSFSAVSFVKLKPTIGMLIKIEEDGYLKLFIFLNVSCLFFQSRAFCKTSSIDVTGIIFIFFNSFSGITMSFSLDLEKQARD